MPVEIIKKMHGNNMSNRKIYQFTADNYHSHLFLGLRAKSVPKAIAQKVTSIDSC